MKTIKVNNLDFDIHPGAVGVSLSGGADSAILLCTLMQNVSGPIHVYTCSSKEKNRIAPKIALDVIGKLMDVTGRNDVYHHVYFTESQTFGTLFGPLKDFVRQHQLNIMYTAGTALPPDDVLATFSNKNDLYEKRNANVTRPVYNGKFYSPWWNMDKKFIAEVYDQLNMTEILFPITRSCEDFNLTEGHCGKCWWCEERIWAFGKC